ncbi:MAG TPA: hypothetical protein PLF00_01985 [Candidatus Marinimicrobia bacterium]|jgi:hypothetical protein|nr:hypothetical protein [Candidatus Neomarinimicrobiota bacterium]
MINFKNVRTLKAILLMIFFTALTGHLISQEKISPNFKVADKLNIKTKFEKPTDKQEFPKPYKVLDSLFVEFYNWVNSYPGINDSKHPEGYIDWTDTDMPQEMLEAFAKAVLWSRFYSDSVRHEYVTLANESSDDQFHRYREMEKEGGTWNEARLERPGWCLGVYINSQISKRMPWMWHYFIGIGYILVVEPFNNQMNILIDPKMPDNIFNRADYFGCYVKNDIIGNFKGPKKLTVTAFPNKYNMENGKQYLVVLSREDLYTLQEKNDHIDGIYYDYSAIDGFTKKQAVFEVIDGKIFDDRQLLFLGQKFLLGTEFTTDSLKQKVQTLLREMMGDYYEKF